MKASETKLQKILEGTQQYVVPLFQRRYRWKKQQWEDLWEDLTELTEQETIRPHFMGSIVRMQTVSAPQGVSKYLLVDGQQRLTTILILLAVVRDRAKQHSNAEICELGEEINQTILINRFKKGSEQYKLQPSQSDRPDFHKIIDTGSPNYEQSLISDCYRFFEKKIRLQDIALNPIKNAIISGLSVVDITLDDDENPYLVFEGLNKGEPLSQADLIRNYFFMKIQEDKQEEIYAQYWKPIEDALKKSLDECLRHYLMKDGSAVVKRQVYFEFKSKIDCQNPLEPLKDLTKFADYYHKLIEPSSEKNQLISNCLMRLRQLDVTTVYPFLLNCYDDYAKGDLSIDEFVEVLKILENFIIRRFACEIRTQSFNKDFSLLYGQIKQRIEGSFLEGLKNILTGKQYPRDEQFKSRLKEVELYSKSGSKRDKGKLILESIEQYFGHKEAVSSDNLSIEHIMPQKLNEDWEKSLGEDWETTHKLLLHTLGNLTLTRCNAELSNYSFSKKREGFLKSDLELNKYFHKKNTWQKEDIEERSEYLAEICLQIWPYFGDASQKNTVEDTVTGTKAKSLFLLGTKYSVNSWQDVLVITMNILADLDEDKFKEMVEDYPKSLNWNGQDFRRKKELENGAFIEANLSAKDINSFCLKALERFGLSSEDWEVEKT